jgi:hypothetical protein
MKTLITVITLCLAVSALAGTHDVGLGTIEAPEDFAFEKGATDSVLGKLTRKSDGFIISFDVGGMAGIHMHEGKKAKCTFYRNIRVGGLPASIGIEPIAEGQRITISIGDLAKMQQSPANFSADIHKDSDIAEFMLIVTTFKLKPNGR